MKSGHLMEGGIVRGPSLKQTKWGESSPRLVVARDKDNGLLLCGGRFQYFNNDKSAIPILPYSSTLHNAGTRSPQCKPEGNCRNTPLNEEESLIKGRKVAQEVVDGCVK